MIREGAEREGGERIPSRANAVNAESNAGLYPMNKIMTRAKIKSRMLNRVSHLGARFYFLSFLKKFFKCLLLRDRAWAGDGQRERETQDLKQIPGSELAAEPNVGLELTNREIMTWAEVGCFTNWATQAHQPFLFSYLWFLYVSFFYFQQTYYKSASTQSWI